VTSVADETKVGEFRKVIRIDEGQLKGHVAEVVRQSVEETLNGRLEAEADAICGATRYERSPERLDTRAGHYTRKLLTPAGEVELRVPRLRKLPFETQIIERYRRRESSVEEALIEMYLAGVSVRRVEDITEALWGTRVSPSTVSELNQKIYAQIDAWRNRPIEGEHAGKGQGGGGDAQGDPCPGRPPGSAGEGRGGRGETGRDEAFPSGLHRA